MDSNLLIVFLFSIIGGAVSLLGGLLLISKQSRAIKMANYATPFAAGALLAAAFLDLLPEAGHDGVYDTALKATLFGVLLFFLLEKFLRWFHHHHEHQASKRDPNISLIIIGDTLHNFIDGIAIAAGFLLSVPTGIVVTIAVAAHEIPQEIGDFGLLIKKGMSRKGVVIVNIISALATTLAAVVFFSLGQSVNLPLDIILGLVAGFFIYIAVSDIIPSIHQAEAKTLAGLQTVMLLVGVLIVGFLTTTLHGYIDSHTEDSDHVEQTSEIYHND
jgi:zinc and cadmium transporter